MKGCSVLCMMQLSVAREETAKEKGGKVRADVLL